MLIRLYFFLGVSQPIVTHSLALDVKQVLLDTLTYIYADDFERIAPVDVSVKLSKKALAIYASNEKETPEMLIQAYKFGTYSKVPEFRNFQLRLVNSIQQAISIRQVALTQILSLSVPTRLDELTKYVNELDVAKFSISELEVTALCDNRDRTMDIKWKAGESQKSFFEILSDGHPIPAPKNSWIQVYGAVPLAVKAWVGNVAVDATSFSVLESVSEQDNFAAHLVYKLSVALQSSVSELEAVVSKLRSRQTSIKETVVAVDSFFKAKQIHELFEAISLARIASNVFVKRNNTNAAQYQKDITKVAEEFQDFVTEIYNVLDVESIDELGRGWLKATELPDLVGSDLVENVLGAVKASYKEFLSSLSAHLV
ncbi:UNVERIFIED_CONTAM: N-alpha-acetyltransferase 25, NatB auxiliary subunit [Siphonaria sp. JEL0065]|nr:N-alpha-acetyltransferase 25, NatB auxiliary subunit [Siphonaria sp. JEL0065]